MPGSSPNSPCMQSCLVCKMLLCGCQDLMASHLNLKARKMRWVSGVKTQTNACELGQEHKANFKQCLLCFLRVCIYIQNTITFFLSKVMGRAIKAHFVVKKESRLSKV